MSRQDGRVTSQDIARWKPSSNFQSAKERREKETNVEYQMRLLERAMADMALRLSYANECYAALSDRITKMEVFLNGRLKEELTSTEISILRDFYKELTS